MSEKIIKYIEDAYLKRCQKNKSYSLRAFSKSVGIEHSALSKILKRKRTLTLDVANRILTALKTQLATKNSLLLTLVDQENFSDIPGDDFYKTLSQEELGQVYKWYYMAIICALDIKKVPPTIQGVSIFLGLDQQLVREVVQVCIKIGIIEIKEEKLIWTSHSLFRAGDDKNEEKLKLKEEHIKQALIVLLDKNNEYPTSYCGYTMSVPFAKLKEADRRIREFGRAMSMWLSEDDVEKDGVYHLSMQFFPLRGRRK